MMRPPNPLAAAWIRLRPWSTLFALFALFASFAGCGGSVGAEGTGTGYVAGPISGFGSIIVGGVRFEDSDATVEDEDGSALPRELLRLGMMVEVDSGEIASAIGGSSAKAERVRIVTSALGPVSAIDPVAQRITILGQTVQVVSSTTVDDELPDGIASIRVGDVICIYGLIDPATGIATATRVAPYESTPVFRMRGVAEGVDAAAQTFRIDGQSFSYAAAGAPEGLAEGALVRVAFAREKDTLGRWVLVASSTAVRVPAAGTDARVEGRVDALRDAGHFDVDGLAVDATMATVTPSGAVVRAGGRVEARGTMEGGVLHATTIEVESDAGNGLFEVAGAIESADAAAQTFVARATLIAWDAATVFEGGQAADLVPGRAVQAEGRLSLDGTRVLASRIVFE